MRVSIQLLCPTSIPPQLKCRRPDFNARHTCGSCLSCDFTFRNDHLQFLESVSLFYHTSDSSPADSIALPRDLLVSVLQCLRSPRNSSCAAATLPFNASLYAHNYCGSINARPRSLCFHFYAFGLFHPRQTAYPAHHTTPNVSNSILGSLTFPPAYLD